MQHKYIELFAGCGGLSLGLQAANFKLVMANELSPMAAETYAFNLFREDLNSQANKDAPKLTKVVWLSSQYEIANLRNRLREDPRNFPSLDDSKGRVCDINRDGSNLEGSLVVGSIVELNRWLKRNAKVAREIKNSFGFGEVDLVSGGPPCQSFSMAGLRQLESDKNSLPWEFAKFVKKIEPKLVLLENVTGILRPFKDESGKSFHAWFELAKAFAAIGYVPLCLHLNAKFAGVPQNRPRFILLGVRANVFDRLKLTFNDAEKKLFEGPEEFFLTKNRDDLSLNKFRYRDVSRSEDMKLFEDSFLAPVVNTKEKFVTVSEAIDDLRKEPATDSEFADELLKTFSKILPKREIHNHKSRSNSPLVRRRFRLYQVLQSVGNETRKNVLGILKGERLDLSDHDWAKLSVPKYLVESEDKSNCFRQFESKKEFLTFLNAHPTKKQTQKALVHDQPAPAALSIPDDACHYHEDVHRTLSVREMARIQSFPDNFEFRSKVTTGGKQRRFEVPQYTQVGNAVPPLLGRALGLAIKNLLKRLN